MKLKLRKLRLPILFIFLLFLTPILSSCQYVNPKKSSIDMTYICNFDKNNENRTVVSYEININNETIYNMKKAYFKFDLFYKNEYIETTDYFENIVNISHGDEYKITGSYKFDKKINELRIKDWYSIQASVYETYNIWIIVFISIICVAIISYNVFIYCTDETLLDVIDDITMLDYDWLEYALIPLPFIIFSSLIPIDKIGWVPLLILTASVLIFILLALFSHFIKFFIKPIKDENYNIVDVENNKNFDEYNKEELINFCRINGISGYSNLNKNELVNLIIDEIENDLKNKTKTELIEICKQRNIRNYKNLTKTELIALLNNSYEENRITKTNNTTGTSKITFDSIAGLEEAKEAFKEKVIMPFKYPEVFKKFDKNSGGGILLYGLPGTGKTMFAEAASNEVDALFIPIKCSDIKSKWYGESEQNIKQIFIKARKVKRAIIFFDEFEAIGAKRNDEIPWSGNNDLVPEILSEMQGIGSESNSTIVVIAATNRPWSIDSAFLRPGRFDEKIYIPLPDEKARKKLFEINLKDLPKDNNLNINYLVELTEGYNGADIKEICEKLKMIAIKKTLNTNVEHNISNDDINEIKDKIKSSVQKEDILNLQEFIENK